MRMKAFGAKLEDSTAAADHAGLSIGGSARLRTNPPPIAAPTLRKSRRSRGGADELLDIVSPRSRDHGSVNGSTDALVCSAAADVAGHRGVNIGIGWLRCGHQQRSCRHDLARLA